MKCSANGILLQRHIVDIVPTTKKFCRAGQSLAWHCQVFAAILATDSAARCQTVIDVPPTTSPTAVASDTTVNLLEGGTIAIAALNPFHIGSPDGTSVNALLNIDGGDVMASGVSARLWIHEGGGVALYRGGVIGEIRAEGGDLTVYGGLIEPGFSTSGVFASSGGTAKILGGRIETYVSSRTGGELLIDGGSVGAVDTRDNGVATIRGGTIGSINGREDSSILLQGGDFRLDGVPISTLATAGSTQQVDIPNGSTLTGVLKDGSPIALIGGVDTHIDAGILNLEAVPVPAIGPAEFRASTDALPHGLRSGQTLVVDNGSKAPDRFTAITGSVVIVEPGGELGYDFEAYGAVVNMSGGKAGGNIGGGFTLVNSLLNLSGGRIWAPTVTNGSRVRMTGGEIGGSLDLELGSQAEISGGLLNAFSIDQGSVAEVYGGDFSMASVVVRPGGVAHIFGGEFSPLGRIHSGVAAASTSEVHLYGSRFKIDGRDIQGLATGQAFVIADRNVTLTGVLKDGSPISLPLNADPPRGLALVSQDAVITITLVPEPASWLILMGLASIAGLRRHRARG